MQIAFNERNSRLLIVLTTTGFIWIALGKLIQLMASSFQHYYISNDFQLGFEHIISPFFVSSITIILFLAVSYCYSEYVNFCHHEPHELKLKYQEVADKKYKLWIASSQIYLWLSVSLTSILMLLFFSPVVWKIISIIIVIASIILFRKFILCDLKSYCKYYLSGLFTLFIMLGAWLFLSTVFFCFGVSFTESSLKPSITAKFSDTGNAPLAITFKAKEPKNLKLTITGESGKKTEIQVKPADFEQAFFETTKKQEQSNDFLSDPKKSDVFIINMSSYEYFKSFDLKSYLQEGKNYIVITFSLHTLFSDRNYKLVNESNVKNGAIRFTKTDFSLEL